MANADTTQQEATRRVAGAFDPILRQLGYDVDKSTVDSWSGVVVDSMCSPSRRFHALHHLFEIADGAQPLSALAILFHDTVQHHVDTGVPNVLRPLVGDAVEEGPDGRVVGPFPAEDPPVARIVAKVFGLSRGQSLSHPGGLNEYLSATAAARLLTPSLSLGHVATVAAAIEATIPFRGPAVGPDSPSEQLARRLGRANERFGLGMEEQEIEQAVHVAVDVANRDVGNFSSPDAAEFLRNTELLIRESMAANARGAPATTAQARDAIARMTGFLGILDPAVVYRAYRGRPSTDKLERLQEKTEGNLSLGQRALQARLLAAGVVEAIALATGGDTPLSLLLGTEPDEPGAFLPDEAAPTAKDADPKVLRLLQPSATGDPSALEPNSAALAADLYRTLGEARLKSAVDGCRDCFGGPDAARKVLDALPAELCTRLLEELARRAPGRAENILALAG